MTPERDSDVAVKIGVFEISNMRGVAVPERCVVPSAPAIGRLKEGWQDDHAAWAGRDLSARRYVYMWADGIHLQARLEEEAQCILVIIGATPET